MKKVLSIFAVIMLATTANASYLYWTVANSYDLENTGKTIKAGNGGLETLNNFQYGVLHMVNGNEDTVVTGIVGLDGEAVAEGETTEGTYAVNIDNFSQNASYYVELIAYTDPVSKSTTQVGYTGSLSYGDLYSEGAISTEESLSPITEEEVAAIWHSAGANAPEPTSALLMLLGVAGLALKRKQRKAE